MKSPNCGNCGRPATIRWKVGKSLSYSCDSCSPLGGFDAEPINREPPGLLDRAAAAEYLGVSPDAFDQHVRPNVKVRTIGSKPMFTAAALDEYANSGAADL